jgi:DNA-directed RNA polymerase specialized sigma subunit
MVQEERVEKMFRMYPLLLVKQQTLRLQTAVYGASPEQLVLAREAVDNEIALTKVIFEALTEDEQQFVTLRYYERRTIIQVIVHMPGWSERGLYRLRQSILTKCRLLIDNMGA